jgi:predicted transcriptional regulator of viral defense system
MAGKAARAVYEIAEDQMGYFTAAQARAAGVNPVTLVRMSSRGTVERVSWGVYRIPNFPTSPYAQFMAASLWPHARKAEVRGVISHASALSVYELSDVSPSHVHITLPRTTRLSRAVPSYLVVHRADLPPADVQQIHGLPVTTPERTIRDCDEAHLGASVVRGAIADAEREGWLQHHQAAQLSAELLEDHSPAAKR